MNPKQTILVVGEDQNHSALQTAFQTEGFKVISANTSQEAAIQLNSHADIAVVITGTDQLKEIKSHKNAPKAIVTTGQGEKITAIKALRLGAVDYFEQPFEMPDLVASVKKTVQEFRAKQEKEDLISRLEARVARTEGKEEDKYWFVSKAKAMMPVNEWLKVLQRESMRSHSNEEPTALIVGENGTGKEGIARMIHAGSKRANGPWITVNCSNFDEHVLEVELFGNGKTKGAFELAKNGTIFIDEIDTMAAKIQGQVAKFLEDREVEVDARVIAATSHNLPERIVQGKFNEDLYHRISKVTVEVPALRSRMEDIIPMGEQFLARAFHAQGKKFDGLTSEAKSSVQNYVWPGNVSELLHVAERTALLWCKSGKVDENDITLPKTSSEFNESYRPGVRLQIVDDTYTFTHLKKQWTNQFEREYLESLLSSFQGNVTAAAKRSGIDRSNLLRLMRRHMISARQYRGLKEAA